jgi:hypothetical protein
MELSEYQFIQSRKQMRTYILFARIYYPFMNKEMKQQIKLLISKYKLLNKKYENRRSKDVSTNKS